MQPTPSSLLLVTHVAIRRGPNGLQIDDQTAAGIAQWCRHFKKVTFYGIEDDAGNPNNSSTTWVDMAGDPLTERCELVALPRAYRLLPMIKEYGQVRAKLRSAISEHQHLSFTFGGLVGDWPAIAAHEAIRQDRRYSAWIDRVEPFVIRNKMASRSLTYKILWGAMLPFVTHNINYLIGKSSVALLQGMDTFEHYARMSNDPHCTYDTHTHSSDQITEAELTRKQSQILDAAPIKIIYVGRAAAMKGPSDWLETLERLHSQNVPFRATWVGDGPELSMMRERVARSGLTGLVELPGFEGGRETLLRRMKESDVFLFCHKTPESARCLIEALVSGCPLVGYETAYSRGLVEAKGGASFAPQNDVAALSDRISKLHFERAALSKLVAEAASSGEQYNEDTLYGHRADLMKRG